MTYGREQITGRGNSRGKGGEQRAKSDSLELRVCEVPIIPFMLRQEMADTVRKGLIKHCCHNQSRLNLGPTKNHSIVPLQTTSHINSVCVCVLFRATRAAQPCQNRGELSSMASLWKTQQAARLHKHSGFLGAKRRRQRQSVCVCARTRGSRAPLPKCTG